MTYESAAETFVALFEKYAGKRKLLLVDIGARGGIHPRWERFFPVVEVLGFEPEQTECDKLNAQQVLSYKARYLPHALGRRNEQDLKFYVCRQPGCSSIYEPNMEFIRDFPFAPAMEVTAVGSVSTTTLSEICSKEQIHPDVIKVDTQGCELDILAGGIDQLTRAKFIELEVEFNPQYIGQPLFHDVDKFMRDHGWVLLGLRRTYWRRKHGLHSGGDGSGGQLVHGDAVYYNPRIVSDTSTDAAELLKFLVILAAYRQNDFVLSILRSAHPGLGALSKKDIAVLESYLVLAPSIPARFLRKLFKWMDHGTKRRLIDALQGGDSVEWYDPDFF